MPVHTNKKQSQRTKGNVRPSSSSQAAQLLAGAGTAPTGFIGFGGFTGSPGYVPASQAFDDIDSSLDSDFRMVLRKLTKKDSTTKIKALQEFGALCEEKDVELLKAVLPYWPRIYNKVAIDVDHKVRESCQQAMNTLVLRVRKNLAPYLKSLMGTWLLCQCDTYQTVATASLQAFQTAFPPAKQADALVYCKSVICEFLTDILLIQTPNSLSDPQTTEKDDMINKYNRVLTSSLLALRKLLTSLPTNQIEDLKEPMRALLTDGKFWKHGKSTILSVKSGMYSFLAGVCQTIPDVAQEFSKKISPFILNSIDEKDPVLCPAVWESVLSLVNFVQVCWQDVSVEKSLWPKLRKLLENGCYGNCTLIGPDLLPFISKVPADLLKDDNKIYTEFLHYMKLGLSKEELQSNTVEMFPFVKAYMECTHFVLKEVIDPTVLNIVLNDQLLPIAVSSVVETTSVLNNSPLYCMLGNSLDKIENTGNDDVNSAILTYWSELSDGIKERLGSEDEAVTMTIVDRVVLLFRNLVFPQISSKIEEKLEITKLAISDENAVQKVQGRNKLTKGMRLFIQKLTLYAFQSAHKHFNAPCLNLFASLMELHPAEDTIKSVIESCHGDVETDQSHSNYFVFNVCLPWLQKIEADEQKQVISIICTFMAMLENDSLTLLLQTLTETLQNFECFHHLLSKCITLETSFSSIRTWLLSDSLGNKLVSIATTVCRESIKPENEVNTQFGWDIISLVLTAEHNSDQIIKEDYIKQILQTIHNTLLSLRVNTDPDKADVAVRFVSKATHSFFLSSRSCLLLPSAEDLLITLLTISLDNSYKVTDETLVESESVWSSGFTSIVKQTGGLIQDGRLLQKTVSVIKERVRSIENIVVFEKVMFIVNKLLGVVKQSLPDGRGDNPVMLELIRSLYIQTDNYVPTQVVNYYMLKGEITYLKVPAKSGTDLGFIQILFSTLFNTHLLCSVKVEPGKQGTSPIDLDPEEIKVLLSVTHCLNVLQQWKQMIRNVSISTPTESLESSVKMVIQQLPSNCRKCFLSAALDRACDKGSLWTTALQSVLHVFSKDTNYTLDFNALLDRCSDLDESKVQLLQTASQYISPENKHTLSEIMVARMICSEPVIPINGGIQALSVLNMVAMDTANLENVKELLQTALSQILTWKENDEDLLLYACNISQSKPEVVFANIEIMKFLQQIVSIVPTILTDKDWDFVMCSVVSFIQSIEESAEGLNDLVEVQMFTCAACRLLSSVVDCLMSEMTSATESFPPNLLTEWNEFFSEGIYGVLLPLFVKMTGKKQSLVSGQMALILKSVSTAVCQCPKQLVLDHKLPPYLKTDDTSDLPDSLQTLLNHVCPLLSHDSREVQLAAFYLLHCIIPDLPQYDKESQESDQEEISRCPPRQLMSVIQNCTRLEDILSGLGVEEYLKISPATEEYTTALSYLLTWRLLLYFFKNSTAEIRQEYAIYFRQTGLVYQLLSNVYRLMSDTVTQPMFDKNFKLQVSDEANSRDIQYLACNVYRHTLQTVPAIVRQWWKDQDRKTINYVDKFTSKNVSQILCTEEIQPVSKTDSQLDNITIKTRPITREVIATYALEEVTIEMVIALPENYPLGTIAVVSEKRVGVSAAVWDKWLLQLNVFLQYQNGSIVDGLRIWKRNIDKRFEGVEDCMICFSVIHGTNYQLPRLTCKTCKKKFHSACLYKWFQTSHNSTCPLCRNLF